MQLLVSEITCPAHQHRGSNHQLVVTEAAEQQNPGRSDDATDYDSAAYKDSKTAYRLAETEGSGDSGRHRKSKQHDPCRIIKEAFAFQKSTKPTRQLHALQDCSG